ncbi:MAG: ribokinase [Acidobacteriaceae bacterium]|nr:ribokinase [Acidobacteriaceae bacterium]
MMSNPRPVVVVGSINIDLVAKAQRIPVTGETVAGLDFRTYPGGKGANQAVAIARLGYPVRMIGRTGDDAFGAQLRDGLRDSGVDVSGVGISQASSGVAVIIVSPSGENVIVVTAGANGLVTPADIDANIDIISSAGIVLTQLEIPLATVEHLGAVCARERVPLMLDPAPACSLPAAVLKHIRWFTPNETEAGFYLLSKGTADSPETIAESLLAFGPEAVVLKLGARGVYLKDHSGLSKQIDGFRVRAVDTTAAGDAFNGAFATALMLGNSPEESARFAAAAAAISVTRAGAQPSMPNMSEVERLLSGD